VVLRLSITVIQGHPEVSLSGGRTYFTDFGHAKIFTIFEGTSEIQRMIIGRAVTGLDVR
jgi:alkylation response protein AidB-like acyl-CoA dehydrogenase